ncbi:MAG TPA: POTRA domain-containing protein [Vicinamibacteria bacterium]|nr:POTRA domain-containing protein [Vicinamibacteria bacterium]
MKLFLLGLTMFGGTGTQPFATERYRGEPIQSIHFIYEGETLPEASRELVELVEGGSYEPEKVRRSIRQLFALGVFSDIKVEAETVPGGVSVTFRLFPRMRIQAVKLELPPVVADLESRLVEVIRVHAGDPLEVEALGEAAERIRTALVREGYLWASVEPEAAFQSPRANVVFHVSPGTRARVGSLQVEGVSSHIEADVRRTIGMSEGSFYSRNELDTRADGIVARWRSLGYYSATIAVTETTESPSRIDLVLLPQLGPRVRIDVRGFDFSDKELRELVPILVENRVTPDLVEESRGNIERNLFGRGFRDATVTVERGSLADGRYTVLDFLVSPGIRYEVARIEIEGLHSLPRDEVRSLMLTRTRRFVRSAPFREEAWQDDLKEVRTYLRRHGFHRARVEGRERPGEEPELLVLVASIDEGPRAVVESVDVEGAVEIQASRVLEAARITPGDPFDATAIVEARERIVGLYRNEGFRRVEVAAQTGIDEAGERASVSFGVTEGDRVRVDRIIVSGLRVTRYSAVEKLIRIETGAPLSSLDLLETRQRLVGSGLFRSVSIDVLPDDPTTHRSDVLITLEEGPRTSFAYGFGYEEQQLARAEIEVTRRNLFGLDRTVSVFTRASFRGGRFITTYRQPDLFGVEVPLIVSAFAEEEDRKSFDYNRVGVGIQVSKRVSEEHTYFLRYRFDRTRVFNLEDIDLIDLPREFRNVRISSISLASWFDRRDDPLNPRSGQFRILDVEWSSEQLGTEAPYIKGLGQQFFYFALPKTLVAALGFRLGVGQTLRQDRDALLPIAERFFAGGATTLRGFGLDEASPKAKITLENGDVVEGRPIGGNVLSLLNLELRFPIFGNLRGVVFSDNGNVYRRLKVIELLQWRYNMGFGFRYETPFGPLRVDYGFKLDRRTVQSIECPDIRTPCLEPLGAWHISLGHAF